jgi:PTH2 family peptidyl-tRNA hydrolase
MTENLSDLLRAHATYPSDTGRASVPASLILEAAEEIERLRANVASSYDEKRLLRNRLSAELAAEGPQDRPQPKMRIYLNRALKDKATPNKLAAHAVHAALVALGVHPDCKVVVLDAGPTKIKQMTTVIHDAGHTQLDPGTMTAGTNWPEDSEE